MIDFKNASYLKLRLTQDGAMSRIWDSRIMPSNCVSREVFK